MTTKRSSQKCSEAHFEHLLSTWGHMAGLPQANVELIRLRITSEPLPSLWWSAFSSSLVEVLANTVWDGAAVRFFKGDVPSYQGT